MGDLCLICRSGLCQNREGESRRGKEWYWWWGVKPVLLSLNLKEHFCISECVTECWLDRGWTFPSSSCVRWWVWVSGKWGGDRYFLQNIFTSCLITIELVKTCAWCSLEEVFIYKKRFLHLVFLVCVQACARRCVELIDKSCDESDK